MSYSISILMRYKAEFEQALRLAFMAESTNKETKWIGYAVSDNCLLLFSYKNGDELTISDLPYSMNFEQTKEFAWGWLQSVEPREKDGWYGGDGDNVKGWKLTTEGVGVGSDNWGAFVKIQPYYIYYGK